MNFKKFYYEIKEQRSSIISDVDRYGLASIPNNNIESYRFYLIIHLILSSQTKDVYTYETMSKLISRNITNCAALSQLNKEQIRNLIAKIGFANKKSEYLTNFANLYKNKIMPSSFEEIMSIKGVGNKMAYLYLQFACNSIQGIGVDTHVLRVSQRLGLDVKTANQCENKLQEIFVKSEWGKINHNLVGFGQEVCRAVNPKCNECFIKHKCPSSRITMNFW